jgi:starvation-inducible outer membrane lipoprotein
MKWLWRSILPFLLIACLASMMTACKSRPPELTGKWTGNSDLSTQMARAPGSLQMQNAKAVPVQVTMTLNQNGGGITGDAAVMISGKPTVHLPITAGVVGQDGKVSIEAARSGFSDVHLSFSGNVVAGQLSGDITLKMDTLLGVAVNKGAITLKQGS